MNINLLRDNCITKSFALKTSVLAVTLALAGCGGGGSSRSPTTIEPVAQPTTKVLSTLSAVTAEPMGANCTTGGAKVNAGLDTNSNAVLDDTEITSTQYVCNGSAGPSGQNGTAGFSSLVAIIAEPLGANCTTGGSKVNVGLDTNNNGMLDSIEVTSFNYVCQGNVGTTGATGASGLNGISSLVAIVPEIPGTNCANGGSKVTGGQDTNANLTLDAGEVTSTTYLCSAPPSGALSYTTITSDTQATSNQGYFVNSTTPVSLNLPTNPVNGDIISVTGSGTGTWTVTQNAGQSILNRSFSNYGQNGNWTARSSANQKNWAGITISGNGSMVFATGHGYWPSQSTDSGITFSDVFPTGLQYQGGEAITSSFDGQRIIAATSPTYGVGRVYVSTDGGSSYSGPYVNNGSNITSLASSSDSMKVIYAGNGIQLGISSDGGITWTQVENGRNWTGVASSSDGVNLVAVASGDFIYVSNDSGITWTARESARNWRSVASSNDGTKLVAVEQGGQIYTSADAGITWTARESARNWISVASSANGNKLFAVDNGGGIYQSVDAGITWTVRTDAGNRSWVKVAMSKDGSKAAAIVQNGYLYTTYGSSSTTVGSAGTLTGGQYDNIQLQYVGNGVFIPLQFNNYTGNLQLN